MKTLRLVVDPQHLEMAASQKALHKAAEILRRGGLVGLPTETVYGLGANALDPLAVARIFAAKQRPAWDPVIVHIADGEEGRSMLASLVCDVPVPARKLMEAFWPGPLTLLLQRGSLVPDGVTAGRPLVGVRMPNHPVALALLRLAGVPIAAPSANTFGHTSPTTADHVLDDLDGRIDAVLDAGPTSHGVESTVVDPSKPRILIYRPGAVTARQIADIAGSVEVFQADAPLTHLPKSAMPSPGVGLRHYAPSARLILIEVPFTDLRSKLLEVARQWPTERLGVLAPAEVSDPIVGAILYPWGRWSVPEELAREMYAGLRALDAQGCTVILCPVPPADGIGMAIRDRLLKASQEAKD